jgi:hypothetical protein
MQRQSPVAALSVSVSRGFVRWPVKLMVPPVRLIVPTSLVVKVPPRFSVLVESSASVPAFVHGPCRVRMLLLCAPMVPAFVQLAVEPTVIVPPPSESIVPSFVRWESL